MQFGAEANENALKLASFHNGKKKVVYFSEAFHGRTSAAVAVTDNPKIVAPVNESENFIKCEFNNSEELEKIFAENQKRNFCSDCRRNPRCWWNQFVDGRFHFKIEKLCKENNSILILDEVQSGYGRSGKFFAHQEFDIKPDLITVAKGMGMVFRLVVF
jgi:acetylornithine aminotransferase